MAVKHWCNVCGKEMDIFDAQEKLTIHNHMGYGSKHDGEEIRIDFCCECFDKIVDACKISPIAQDIYDLME